MRTLSKAAFVMAPVVLCCALRAQSNPLSVSARAEYTAVKNDVIGSAEAMPAADYTFKPTAEVRTFAQQIAHIADDQYNYCSYAKGETRQAAYSELEHTLSAKKDLVAALRNAFAYCDEAYNALTDASAADMVTARKRSTPKLGILNENTGHTWLHYGNIIVYLRLKGLIPPSSAPKGAQP